MHHRDRHGFDGGQVVVAIGRSLVLVWRMTKYTWRRNLRLCGLALMVHIFLPSLDVISAVRLPRITEVGAPPSYTLPKFLPENLLLAVHLLYVVCIRK